MLMTLYNTRTAAEKIGCSQATVSRVARRYEIGERVGPNVVFTDSDLKKIAENCHEGPGNPHFGAKTKLAEKKN